MLDADWKRHSCLVAYLGAHGRDCHSLPEFIAALAVLVCRYFPSYTEFQLIADGDIILDLDISRIETLRKPNGLMY